MSLDLLQRARRAAMPIHNPYPATTASSGQSRSAAKSVATSRAEPAKPTAKAVPTAAERAAAAERQRRAQAIAEARAAAAAEEAKRVRAEEIRQGWARAHARVTDPFGNAEQAGNSTDQASDADDSNDPHGWKKIAAELNERRGL